MGLCKCPKKKVTNLFCFEHRVNVCEHCLVANHQRCIVQSYLQWLQDSDYDPTCRQCGKNLCDDTGLECVRLLCYDVFHWSCLDQYCRQLPANTAPAGYTCPMCKSGIFPASNIASPVAESLRQFLSKVNWARAGLGLPLIDEPAMPQAPPTKSSLNASAASEADSTMQSFSVEPAAAGQQMAAAAAAQVAPALTPMAAQAAAVHSVAGGALQDVMPYARGDKPDFYQNTRKVFDSTKEDHLLNMTHDHDEDKYKRRPAMQWLTRWFKSRAPKQRNDPNAPMKRLVILMVLAVIAFMTLIVIFTRVGRASADNDPFLDPMANPNIRVGD